MRPKVVLIYNGLIDYDPFSCAQERGKTWEKLSSVNLQGLSRLMFEDVFGVACHCHIVRSSEEVQTGKILEDGVEWIGDRELV